MHQPGIQRRSLAGQYTWGFAVDQCCQRLFGLGLVYCGIGSCVDNDIRGQLANSRDQPVKIGEIATQAFPSRAIQRNHFA
ncbi:hypothetical protein D3C76_1633150 [compost metagenome]